MEINLDTINQRRLEMVRENKQVETVRIQAQQTFQQAQVRLAELEIELRILDKWEAQLKENKAGEKC